jgi:hypothetical protein
MSKKKHRSKNDFVNDIQAAMPIDSELLIVRDDCKDAMYPMQCHCFKSILEKSDESITSFHQYSFARGELRNTGNVVRGKVKAYAGDVFALAHFAYRFIAGTKTAAEIHFELSRTMSLDYKDKAEKAARVASFGTN